MLPQLLGRCISSTKINIKLRANCIIDIYNSNLRICPFFFHRCCIILIYRQCYVFWIKKESICGIIFYKNSIFKMKYKTSYLTGILIYSKVHLLFLPGMPKRKRRLCLSVYCGLGIRYWNWVQTERIRLATSVIGLAGGLASFRFGLRSHCD